MKALRFAKRWWVPVAGAAAGLLAGIGLAITTPHTYTATAMLFIGLPPSADSTGAYQGDLFAQGRAATYVQMFSTDDLAVKVIDDLSLSLTPRELETHITAKQLPKTVLLDVTASDTTAKSAADLANAYAANFVTYAAKLETPMDSPKQPTSITVVQKAVPPSAPASPSVAMDAGMGLVAGAVLGGGAMWAARRFDRPVGGAALIGTS